MRLHGSFDRQRLTSYSFLLQRYTLHGNLVKRALSEGSTGGSSSSAGPPLEKLKAVPFRLSKKEAVEAFDNYHTSGFFASLPHGGIRRAGAKYLPFWVISANVRSTIKSAQVGYDYAETVFNIRTQRPEMVWRTRWRWIESAYGGKSRYSAEDPEMQVYASYAHRRSFLNNLRGPVNTQIVPFTAQVLATPDPGVLPTIDPFTMKPRIALHFVTEHIRSNENRLAEDYIRKTYRADRTRFVNVQFELSNVRVSPVYVPCYALGVEHLGRELFTFVHGSSSTQVGGQKFLNTAKVTLSVAAVSASLLAVSGLPLLNAFWIGVTLPAVLAGTWALVWPLVSLSLRDLRRSWELKRHADTSNQAAWDEDFVAKYEAGEEQARRSQWWEERQREWGPTGREGYGQRQGKRELKEDHYKTLGIDPRASKQDIQAAFRALAMKYHPDRFADPKEKEGATKKFQKISAAYTVLRDPAKRRDYDASR